MKKFIMFTASAALLGSAVIQPINTINSTNIVYASERAYFTQQSGIYPDRYNSARKAIAGASAVAIVEKSDDGWYKVKTYLGEMWMKNGFTGAKNPEKPVEYSYVTKTTGLFKEMNKGVRTASVGPQRVIVLERGTNGWVKIQTWLGALWMKDGLMEVGQEPVVEPTEPEPTSPEESEAPPEPDTEEPIEEPVAEEPATPQPEFSYLTQSGGLYTTPHGGKRVTIIGPQRLILIERGEDGWMKVQTWLGALWTKNGYTAEQSPVKVLDSIISTQTSGLYSQPNNSKRVSSVSPQRLNVLEQGADGWVKVNTWLGGMWMKDGFNGATSPHKALGYAYLTQTSGIYKDKHGTTKLSVVSPQRLIILEHAEEGWFRTSSWLGDVWVKDGYNVAGKDLIDPVKYANTALSHIQMTSDAIVYENMLGSVQAVGEAMSGQQYVLLGETDTYYQIDFGQGTGLIEKSNATLAERVYYDNAIDGNETNNLFITLRDTNVYKAPGTHTEKIGEIEDNLRYPIVKQEFGWYVVDFGGRKGYVNGIDVKADKGVPVLMYHHYLMAGENDKYLAAGTTVTTANFEKQMAYLRQESFTYAMPDDMEKFVKKEMNLPGRVVSITMDDGYKSNSYYAAPIMEKYGYRGTVFFSTKWLQDRTGNWDSSYLQWMSTEEIANSHNALEFQSHTDMMHFAIEGSGAINKWSYNDARTDIKNNLDKLERASGYRPTHFAYPFGSYSDQAINVLKDNGVRTAYTTVKGYVNPGDNPYLLNRFDIKHSVSMAMFEEYLGHK